MTDMTIKAVRTTMLRVPWPDTPWLKGHAFGEARNLLVLEVETKGGIVGMGYLFSFRPGLKTIVAALEETIVPHVIGKDATAVEGIWHDLWKRPSPTTAAASSPWRCRRSTSRCGTRIGKRANLPLHRLWGHVRSQLPAYGCGCFRGSGGDGMIAKALHYKSQGYKAIKMQMAHTDDLRGDLDNVKRMREALGPDIDIMIDINQGWTADVAINQGRKIVDYDIYWLEEPVPADDFKGYMRVADALPIRIVGGETHFTRFDLRPFFENPKVPILQPDPMRGGYTDLRKISVLADTWGLQMAPHLFPELNVQLLASIPNGAWIEDMGLSEDLWVEPVKVVNGTITAPERPGHGLAFKPEILKDCKVLRRACAPPLHASLPGLTRQSMMTSQKDAMPGSSPGMTTGQVPAEQKYGCSAMTQLIAEDMMVPSEPGIEIFVRNKRPANLAKYTAERTLLFVHGSTYPAHTGFDIPLGGQSWMEFIATRGYDVYCLDVRGYGRSTRPAAMAEPAAEQSAGGAHARRGEGHHRGAELHSQAAQHRKAQPARLVVGLHLDGDHRDPESGQGCAADALRAAVAAHRRHRSSPRTSAPARSAPTAR